MNPSIYESLILHSLCLIEEFSLLVLIFVTGYATLPTRVASYNQYISTMALRALASVKAKSHLVSSLLRP